MGIGLLLHEDGIEMDDGRSSIDNEGGEVRREVAQGEKKRISFGRMKSLASKPYTAKYSRRDG